MEIVKHHKTALLVGATGLVGYYCLQQLLAHDAYDKVVVFSRRPLKITHAKIEEHVIDFDRLGKYQHLFKGNDLFSCLGTTMAKAGSKEAFYTVDFVYPYQVALLAIENGVNQLLLVSSVGADPESVFYYSRVKGDLEVAVKKLPFWAIHIFQPSVLLGERNENRWGEQIAGRLARGFDYLTGGMLTKYKPIEAEVVAQAMVSAAQGLKPGTFVYPSHYLQRLAGELDAEQPRLRGRE